jgi:tetratricopeptide (TPR) repeat protein
MGWLVHSRLAEVYEQMGEYDRALLALHQAGDRGGSARANRARVLTRMGRRDEARRLLAEAETNGTEPVHQIAAAYAALSDNDKAFAILFELIDRGEPGPNFVAVDPPFDTLHSDPRWPELVRRLSTQRHTRTGAR